MTPAELKSKVKNQESKFFSRMNMKFSGDTMDNYGVRSAKIFTMYDDKGKFVSIEGVEVEVWELYRKKSVKHGLKSSAYFTKTNFSMTYPSK